jgi:hypothetical protein
MRHNPPIVGSRAIAINSNASNNDKDLKEKSVSKEKSSEP